MKNHGSFDTNALLRLIIKDVPLQNKAVTNLLQQAENFRVDDIAVIEVVFALHHHYGFSRRDIASAIMLLMQLDSLTINNQLFIPAFKLYLDHQSLSFEDCCLAVSAQLSNTLPLWTFDKKLVKQSHGLAKEIK